MFKNDMVSDIELENDYSVNFMELELVKWV